MKSKPPPWPLAKMRGYYKVEEMLLAPNVYKALS